MLVPYEPSHHKSHHHHVDVTFPLHRQQHERTSHDLYQDANPSDPSDEEFDVVLVSNHRGHQEVLESKLQSRHTPEMNLTSLWQHRYQ